jgi:hypothetical protein
MTCEAQMTLHQMIFNYLETKMKNIKHKTITGLLLCYFVTLSPAFAQTVYEVTPGTKGNEIILSIENESKSEEATDVQIKPVKYPETIKFTYMLGTIGKIEKEGIKDIGFEFDIEREAVSGKRDTLIFRITDANGSNWNKEIVLEYSKPLVFSLSQNYPNPFNPSTMINYQIPMNSEVSLKIYDILGKEVSTLVNEKKDAGFYEIKFDGSQFASGVYIYRMIAGDFIQTKKLMLLK